MTTKLCRLTEACATHRSDFLDAQTTLIDRTKHGLNGWSTTHVQCATFRKTARVEASGARHDGHEYQPHVPQPGGGQKVVSNIARTFLNTSAYITASLTLAVPMVAAKPVALSK